jgi:hypothetical protein
MASDSATRPGWWAIARSRPVVLRALGYLVVVGGILIAINHGDALLRGELDGTRWIKMLLTPLVPYVVSTLSSVGAIRAAAVPGGARSDTPPAS